MKVNTNTVVSFHYRLKQYQGDDIEETYGGDPVVYLHGHKNIPLGVEEGLEGREAGEQFNLVVPPELAYGLKQENGLKRVPLKHLRCHGKPTVGHVAQVNTDAGPRQVIIRKLGKFNADVDFNHPLAGQTLEFDIEVIDVRDATDEELGHGHAHGPGGHHH